VTDKVSPTWTWLKALLASERTGAAVFVGVAGRTALVAFDEAEPEPPEFEAVTTTRRKRLRSVESTT